MISLTSKQLCHFPRKFPLPNDQVDDVQVSRATTIGGPGQADVIAWSANADDVDSRSWKDDGKGRFLRGWKLKWWRVSRALNAVFY